MTQTQMNMQRLFLQTLSLCPYLEKLTSLSSVDVLLWITLNEPLQSPSASHFLELPPVMNSFRVTSHSDVSHRMQI